MQSQKNKLSLKSYSLYSVILACSALVFAVLLSVMMLTVYEPDVHYFKNGSPWFSVFVWGVIAVGIAAMILALTQKKDAFPTCCPSDATLNRAISAVTGSLLLGTAVSEFILILGTDVYSTLGQPVYGISRLFTGRFNTVSSVAAILAFISAFYFLLPIFSAKVSNNVRILFGCVLTAFFIFRLLVLYYDVATPINSPVKMIEQMAVVGAMLFIVYEMRFLLGEPKPRSYVVISTVTFILLAAHSTSQIVADIFLVGMIPVGFTVFFELAFAIYIFAGLISYLTVCKFYIPEPVVEEAPEIEILDEIEE